ncbi:MAG: DNA double-strand break repair nuclease NurA [Anaerolineae bacterium]
MPVDFQQIQARIIQISERERERQNDLKRRKELALRALDMSSVDLDALSRKVDLAIATDSHVRCAKPVSEPITSSWPCPPACGNATLIAVDGSQVNPDRHAAVQFAIVNAGAVVMKLRSGEVTELCTNTELLYGEDLETESGMMSERLVALRRDIKEREMFDDLSKPYTGDIVTFTDGPLELWSTEAGEEAREFALFLQRYKGVLSRLQERGVATAGYVDKPGANLVIRMLEFAEMTDEQLRDRRTIRTVHPFRGVDDRLLFSGSKDVQPLILPGYRSAVFRLQSSSQDIYTGDLALHFFYLNVGDMGHPWLVRVEIPHWVAADQARLDLLHAVLVEQCGIMGNKPYPYLLHRAHETAVVRLDEKGQIERMLQLEFSRQGWAIGEQSAKQSAKNAAGRKSS